MDHEQSPANQTNATQVEAAPSNVPCDFSDTTYYTINNLSSYANYTIRRRRNQRRLRRHNTFMLNYIRRLTQIQNTNDLLTNQFFNGYTFP
ncbi:hypothetical protein GLOIN_2v1835724 [Rhizophagus clarus]|uniref:Uncharacterized protein n=1 Tax=Rhizophagus clarus TaxID=94130 RepID=A0A8H3R5X9_9GLOM|nr:hypothetical protein GLOIN_2v1835724 [Rhizophagus clarus]